ncbi:hypothetical protein AB0P05_45775, partial [Streptomyces flaveolus]|uniref:hypothetical protein n=1 Tax=Streptomyces flaveolus TaxID=67297 RepID=UPI00341BBD72
MVAAMASEAGRRAHEVPATGAWAASRTTVVAAAAASVGAACDRPGGAVTPAVHASAPLVGGHLGRGARPQVDQRAFHGVGGNDRRRA